MTGHESGPPETWINQLKRERTGWRDIHLSQRHRQWGLRLPAYDMDFILMEVDRCKAVALIEYKMELAAAQFASDPAFIALAQLGDVAQLPVFVVRYAQNFSWWKVTSLNEVAKKMFPERQDMTEKEFVTFLYQLRGLKPPPEIFRFLETAI